MRAPLPSSVLLLLTFSFNTAAAFAAQPPPKFTDLPSDAGRRGALFLAAWEVFHQEMNGLCAAKVRESESDGWFDAAPVFLLREITRLASDPEVRYQAAVRLAAHPTEENLRGVRALREQYQGRLLGTLAAGVLISARDKEVRAQVAADLKSPVMKRRAAAGAALAAAFDREGLDYLRAALKQKGEEARFAAWALGRFGRVADERRLAAVAKSRPDAPEISAALGELELRRLFPDLYAGYLSRFRFHADGFSPDGMYTVWFGAVHRAVSSGARTPESLRDSIIQQKRALRGGDAQELTDRRLSAFLDFLTEMNRMGSGPTEPVWPRTRAEAERALHGRKSPDKTSERIAAERIAAAISLVVFLAPSVGYFELAEPTPELAALSPNGERALDGNPATSKHLTVKSPLILSHPPGRLLTLWVLSACRRTASADGTASPALRISGTDRQGAPWDVTVQADKQGALFREIPINRASGGQIRIFPLSPGMEPSTCISEIRALAVPESAAR